MKRTADGSARHFVASESELAEHWGVTDRRVRQLDKAGIAIKTAGGYDVLASDKAFIGWLRRDDPGQQARRRRAEMQAEMLHRRLQRQDRELLTPNEVWESILEAWNALSLILSALTTKFYQETHSALPKVATELVTDAKREAAHLFNVLVLPIREQMLKTATDEQRLEILRATRQVRVLTVEHDLEPEPGTHPDETPFSGSAE